MTRRNDKGLPEVHCLQIREIVVSGTGASGGYCGITAAELAARVAIERRNESGVKVASRSRVMDSLVAELGGRCHGCGELIGDDIPVCPICRTPQKITWQRNAAKRKTIGWKGGSKANGTQENA